MDIMTTNGPPAIFATSQRSHVIRYREYIGDIITGSAGAFTIQKFALNPGVATTFPWLSQIAVNFEQYIFKGMIFEFKSTSADALNSTNTALGVVIIATDYDAVDSPFVTKQQMEQQQFCSSGRQSSSLLHPIECSRQQTPIVQLYVRGTPGFPSGSDPRLWDLGNTYVATQGAQGSAVNIGELWVSYEVEFFKPQFNVNPATSGAHFQCGDGTTNITNTNLFFNQHLSNGSPDIGVTLGTVATGNPNTINLPTNDAAQTLYFISMTWYGDAGSVVTAGSRTYVNSNSMSFWQNDTGLSNQVDAGTTQDALNCEFVSKKLAPGGAAILLSNTTAWVPPANCKYADIWVMKIPQSILA